MKIEHKHLDDLVRAYAASAMVIDGEMSAFFASEEKGYPCYMYQGDQFEKCQVVWENGGGCMSILPIPGKANEILAIVDFYLKESPSKARLIWGKYENKQWIFDDVIALPFLHRFDIYNVQETLYVVLATIADDKEYKDDWRKPGSIYYAKLPEKKDEKIEKLHRVEGHYFRNHGYYRRDDDQGIHGYFTSDEGIFRLTPQVDAPWTMEKILSGQIGEVALIDINGDGKDELITIEPFHGNAIKIYEQDHQAGYREVFNYPYKIDFAHTLVGATLAGKPCFVGGVRREESEVFVITYSENEYHLNRIDLGAGPANLCVTHKNGQDYIISANHTRNECATYHISE